MDKHGFNQLMAHLRSKLYRFALSLTKRTDEAEDVVQEVGVRLWERRDDLKIHVSLTSYLFILIKNRCIDHLRRLKHAEIGKQKMQEQFDCEQQMKLYSLEALDNALLCDNDIEQIIHRAIDSLPPKCREIFILNKMDGKKYREIAEELHISVSTVENQIGIALKKLREQLKDYMPVLLFLIYL